MKTILLGFAFTLFCSHAVCKADPVVLNSGGEITISGITVVCGGTQDQGVLYACTCVGPTWAASGNEHTYNILIRVDDVTQVDDDAFNKCSQMDTLLNMRSAVIINCSPAIL